MTKIIYLHKKQGLCRHQNILIDSQLASVKCGDCGEVLNPIWVLERLAQKQSLYKEREKRLEEAERKFNDKSRNNLSTS